MYELNDKVKNLVPYDPICGTYDIRLDANESPFNLEGDILEQVKTAVSQISFNRYPDPLCTELTKAFADFYEIDGKNVTVGNGSDELISIIESSLLKKGDKLLVLEPDFSMYGFYSSICEVQCFKSQKQTDLKIDIDTLIKKINSENINMLIFSNPCNPTGQAITANEARHLVSSVSDCLVVLDEAYMDFYDETLINEVQNYNNLIILRTASKAIGCASLRLGFAVANEKITNALRAVKSPYNVNCVSQAIGTVIYNNKEFLKNQQKIIVNNTKILYNELTRISACNDDFHVYETCANFVFVKTNQYKEIFEYLKNNSVVIRKFNGYLRITSGKAFENKTVISLLDNYFSLR